MQRQVIGLDYRTFCDEIVAAVPRRPRGGCGCSRRWTTSSRRHPAPGHLDGPEDPLGPADRAAGALAHPHRGGGISLACIVAVAVGLVTWVCRTALRRPPGGGGGAGGLWKVFLLALVVFAALFLPRVILPSPWGPSGCRRRWW